MSTRDYGIYKIGTVGLEPIKPDGFMGDLIDAVRKVFFPFNTAYNVLSALRP
jgi:hypothetical protein